MLYDFGHDVGVPDGIPGAKTREAVRAEQERRNLPQDGRVGKRIYDAVKASWPPLAAPARPPSQPGQQ